jgi:hypothetical protein
MKLNYRSASPELFTVYSDRMAKLASIAKLLLSVLLGIPSADASTTVFNNIAAAPPYYSTSGNWIGTLGTEYEICATTFTPSLSGQLSDLTVGLHYLSGSNSVTLRLSPNTAGVPGVPIWQTTVPPAPSFGSLLNVTVIAGPTLNAGQIYWLEGVAPVSPPTLHNWLRNNQGDFGLIIQSGMVSSEERFALRVGVVPEPASLSILSLTLIGLPFCLRMRIPARRSSTSCWAKVIAHDPA